MTCVTGNTSVDHVLVNVLRDFERTFSYMALAILNLAIMAERLVSCEAEVGNILIFNRVRPKLLLNIPAHQLDSRVPTAQ